MNVHDVTQAEQIAEDEYQFVVRFDAGGGEIFVLGPCCGADETEMPPVSEFWSIPIYDIQGYFVDNKIKRYTVNSFMYERGEFSVDKDGRLTFYIQHEEPADPNQRKNWLPVTRALWCWTKPLFMQSPVVRRVTWDCWQPTMRVSA